MEGEAVALELDAILMQARPDNGSAGLSKVNRQILGFGAAHCVDDMLRASTAPLFYHRIGKTLLENIDGESSAESARGPDTLGDTIRRDNFRTVDLPGGEDTHQPNGARTDH